MMHENNESCNNGIHFSNSPNYLIYLVEVPQCLIGFLLIQPAFKSPLKWKQQKNSTNNFIKKMFVIHDTTSDIRHPRARLVFICIHSYNTFCCRTDKTLQILTQVNR